MRMIPLEYQMSFTSPAFLGNASQNGQWRNPPIKASMRQWWRVAYAAAHAFKVDVAIMRNNEGALFGAASGNDMNRSLVRLRLDKWSPGSLGKDQRVKDDLQVSHPEVSGKSRIGSGLYLGYGPFNKDVNAIQAGESASLEIAAPEEHRPLVQQSLALMHYYGTLGGRSLNGWGSFDLTPRGDESRFDLSGVPLRPWREALSLDWAHALGRDDRPLVWQTAPFDNWRLAMQRLAEIKIGLRTRFKFPAERTPHERPQMRHWLSYPVTRHTVKEWGDKRLPNTLRFKVRRDPVDAEKLRGVIFHVPCRPPQQFKPDLKEIEQVWTEVHEFLDKSNQLERIDR